MKRIKQIAVILLVDSDIMNSKMDVDELCFIKTNSTEHQFRLYF